MGSKGIKARKPRRRLPPAGQGDWGLENAPFTFEGQIEGLGRFARGARGASSRNRWIAIGVVATFVVPFALGFVIWLVDRF
jgi:hypothetical protein